MEADFSALVAWAEEALHHPGDLHSLSFHAKVALFAKSEQHPKVFPAASVATAGAAGGTVASPNATGGCKLDGLTASSRSSERQPEVCSAVLVATAGATAGAAGRTVASPNATGGRKLEGLTASSRSSERQPEVSSAVLVATAGATGEKVAYPNATKAALAAAEAAGSAVASPNATDDDKLEGVTASPSSSERHSEVNTAVLVATAEADGRTAVSMQDTDGCKTGGVTATIASSEQHPEVWTAALGATVGAAGKTVATPSATENASRALQTAETAEKLGCATPGHVPEFRRRVAARAPGHVPEFRRSTGTLPAGPSFAAAASAQGTACFASTERPLGQKAHVDDEHAEDADDDAVAPVAYPNATAGAAAADADAQETASRASSKRLLGKDVRADDEHAQDRAEAEAPVAGPLDATEDADTAPCAAARETACFASTGCARALLDVMMTIMLSMLLKKCMTMMIMPTMAPKPLWHTRMPQQLLELRRLLALLRQSGS